MVRDVGTECNFSAKACNEAERVKKATWLTCGSAEPPDGL